MKRSLICCKSFVLMVLVAILLFATGRAAQAQLMGDDFQFTLSDSTALSQDGVTAQPVLPPFNSDDPLSDDADIEATQLGYMSMTYLGTDGQYHLAYDFISIDNTSGAISVLIGSSLYPVATLADVFPTLPVPPAAAPATLVVWVEDPITLTIQGIVAGVVPAAVVGPTYVTDLGAVVITLSRGRPVGVPNLTVAQARASIGAALYAKLTVIGPPTWSYDCHGFTFTNGAKWINNNQVQKILNDNGYMQVAANMAQVGDVVIYKLNGSIVHSGVVRRLAGGVPNLVRSKFGGLGLYDHAPTDVPASYGIPSYWHSNRAGGNLLKTK